MYWIDDAFTLILVIAIFWLIGLALCVGIPLLICHIFHLKVSLWVVSIVFVLVWIVGTYIYFTMPV